MLPTEFPDASPDDIALLLGAGFRLDEIRSILSANFSHTHIMALIGRIQSAQQHGTDLLGLTADQLGPLVLNIAATCNYADPAHPDQQKQAREVGKIARELIANLVAIEKPIYDLATGEELPRVDTETGHARIEVT